MDVLEWDLPLQCLSVYFFQVFQNLEEERIIFLRNELWVQANIMSQTYVDNDQVRDFLYLPTNL